MVKVKRVKKEVEKEFDDILLSLRKLKKHALLTCRLERPLKDFVELEADEMGITISEYLSRLLLSRIHSKLVGGESLVESDSFKKIFK